MCTTINILWGWIANTSKAKTYHGATEARRNPIGAVNLLHGHSDLQVPGGTLTLKCADPFTISARCD